MYVVSDNSNVMLLTNTPNTLTLSYVRSVKWLQCSDTNTPVLPHALVDVVSDDCNVMLLINIPATPTLYHVRSIRRLQCYATD